jgi:hypothetical protein
MKKDWWEWKMSFWVNLANKTILLIHLINKFEAMESLFREDENESWESEIINFMKVHRHLTVK